MRDPCRYRPNRKVLRDTFAFYVAHGKEKGPMAGSASAAFHWALDTGDVRISIIKGTVRYAAAMAGLCVRKHAQMGRA